MIKLRAVFALPSTTTLLGRCSALTAFNTLVPKDSRARLVRTDIAFGPSVRQRLDVYAPDRAHGSAPVILFIYGGGWDSGAKGDYSFVGRALAAQGFVTVIADYRLVPEVRFPVFIEDGAQAIGWIHNHIHAFGGDPTRLYLLGHSAGAYNALMLTLDARYLEQVGLTAGAVRATAGLAGPYDFLPLAVDQTIGAFGRSADSAATQPINFLRRSAPPVFLAAGADDETVYPRNTVGLAARLRAVGAHAEDRIYPAMSHAGIMLPFALPFRGRASVLADVVDFFRRH